MMKCCRTSTGAPSYVNVRSSLKSASDFTEYYCNKHHFPAYIHTFIYRRLDPSPFAMTTYIPSLTLPHAVFESAPLSILLPVLAGTSIGYSSRPKKETQSAYRTLKQPPGNPPAYVFGPVWTTLYALMGYASFRAWNIGMSSVNPNTRQLAMVSTHVPFSRVRAI